MRPCVVDLMIAVQQKDNVHFSKAVDQIRSMDFEDYNETQLVKEIIEARNNMEPKVTFLQTANLVYAVLDGQYAPFSSNIWAHTNTTPITDVKNGVIVIGRERILSSDSEALLWEIFVMYGDDDTSLKFKRIERFVADAGEEELYPEQISPDGRKVIYFCAGKRKEVSIR